MGTDLVKIGVDSLTSEQEVDVAFIAAGHQASLDSAIRSVKTGGTIFNTAIL
jgi:threonine dehydrogenase-like Zn-dependent dehydrogenase